MHEYEGFLNMPYFLSRFFESDELRGTYAQADARLGCRPPESQGNLRRYCSFGAESDAMNNQTRAKGAWKPRTLLAPLTLCLPTSD